MLVIAGLCIAIAGLSGAGFRCRAGEGRIKED
ncbi:hypothetical protein EDF56_106405 [Novosphingobium sp. PhB165]|nr:hypothetical protein EDF56_106405 [Novosphingobium sp. PhB165]